MQDVDRCNDFDCPIDCQWGLWNDWSGCGHPSLTRETRVTRALFDELRRYALCPMQPSALCNSSEAQPLATAVLVNEVSLSKYKTTPWESCELRSLGAQETYMVYIAHSCSMLLASSSGFVFFALKVDIV